MLAEAAHAPNLPDKSHLYLNSLSAPSFLRIYMHSSLSTLFSSYGTGNSAAKSRQIKLTETFVLMMWASFIVVPKQSFSYYCSETLTIVRPNPPNNHWFCTGISFPKKSIATFQYEGNPIYCVRGFKAAHHKAELMHSLQTWHKSRSVRINFSLKASEFDFSICRAEMLIEIKYRISYKLVHYIVLLKLIIIYELNSLKVSRYSSANQN